MTEDTNVRRRRPLPLVERAGFVVQESHRSRLGMVERLRAVQPAEGDTGPAG